MMTNRRNFIKKVTAGVTAITFGGNSMGFSAKSKAIKGDKQVKIMDKPDQTFLQNCAFISIDFQPYSYHPVTDEQMPRSWLNKGKKAEDVNSANRYLVETAMPNGCRVATVCRTANLPMIFVHWGYLFRNGMDLDPVIYNSFITEFGSDTTKWPHHISDKTSKPAEEFSVREGEYIIPKTSQDAFPSSNIGYVLQNLNIKNIVFVGGHTGACLGKSAKSAIRLGYKTLCVKDATFDAFTSTHMENLNATGYHYIMTTADFEEFIRKT
jgi:nicotinamidase-related amidase